MNNARKKQKEQEQLSDYHKPRQPILFFTPFSFFSRCSFLPTPKQAETSPPPSKQKKAERKITTLRLTRQKGNSFTLDSLLKMANFALISLDQERDQPSETACFFSSHFLATFTNPSLDSFLYLLWGQPSFLIFLLHVSLPPLSTVGCRFLCTTASNSDP